LGDLPSRFLSTFPGGFVDQVVGTALLSPASRHHRQPELGRPPQACAVVVGLLVVLIARRSVSTGYAINPRVIRSALFTFVAGWAARVPRRHVWWWVPSWRRAWGALLGGWSTTPCRRSFPARQPSGEVMN